MNDAFPASSKYKNKFAVSILAEWQRIREVKVLVLNYGGLFKDYDFNTQGALTIWMEFSVVFSGQMELYFFSTKETK